MAAITVRSAENGSINKVIAVIVSAEQTITEITYDESGIIAYYADSEDSEKGMAFKENAVDNDLGTMWHTQWFTETPPHDHEIRFDLGQPRALNRLCYYPRQDANANGTVGSYEVYVSNDSTDWGSPVSTGTFTWPDGLFKEARNVEFSQTVTGQFIRFVAKDEVQSPDNAFTSMAELYFKADFDGVSMNSEEITIGTGESVYIEAEIVPVNDTITYPVTWTSSNEDIASVQYGHVTGNDNGVTWIIASILDGMYADTCLLKVGEVNDTLISFPMTSMELPVNKDLQLEVLTFPEGIKAAWESDNEAVATVDANGMLSTLSYGNVNITASIAGGRYSTTLGIEVVETSIHFDLEKDTLLVGAVIETSFTAHPSNQDITLTSSDSAIAFISGGIIVARSPGDVQIIASINDGSISDTLDIHVYEPYARFSVNELEMLIGTEYTMELDVFPDTCEIVWASYKESVATVSPEGIVSAAKTGTTLISASINNGLFRALCLVNVIIPELELSTNNKDLQVGSTFALSAIPVPDTCAVSWFSDSPGIVSVSEHGVIEALSPGNATITASILNGATTQECKVTAYEPGITFSQDTATVIINNPTNISLTTLPSGADITWISLDEETVSVDNGAVIGLKIGTAKVVASILDGAYSDTCVVKVTAPDVSISQETAEIYVGNTIRLTAFVFSSGFTVEWISSDPEIATVALGQVKGIRDGTVTIRAQIAGGLSYAECVVTVMGPDIDIPEDTVFLDVNDTGKLTAQVSPSGYSVAWESEDEEIVTVNNGNLTAVSEGSAKVFASVYNGFYSDSCVVVVSDPVSTQELKNNDFQLYPVPTKGLLYIKGDRTIEGVEVINLQGQILKQVLVHSNSFDISDLENGTYFIRIRCRDTESILKKVVQQK